MASRLSSPQRRTSPSPVCRGRQTKVSLLKQPPASHRAIGKYEHQVQALLSLKQDQLEPVNGISPSSNNWPFEGYGPHGLPSPAASSDDRSGPVTPHNTPAESCCSSPRSVHLPIHHQTAVSEHNSQSALPLPPDSHLEINLLLGSTKKQLQMAAMVHQPSTTSANEHEHFDFSHLEAFNRKTPSRQRMHGPDGGVFVPSSQSASQTQGLHQSIHHGSPTSYDTIQTPGLGINLGDYEQKYDVFAPASDSSAKEDSVPPLTPTSASSDLVKRTRSGRVIGDDAAPQVLRSNTGARVTKTRTKPIRQKSKSSSNHPVIDAPLSELTKDMEIPVRDMEAWAHRPIEERLIDVAKRNGKVPRPMNAFMLYRSAYSERTKAWCVQNNHQVVSAVSGASWPLEPQSVRDFYTEMARIERDNHQLAHPDYKFSPSKNGPASRKKKLDYSDDEDSDLSVQGDGDSAYRPITGRRTRRTTRGEDYNSMSPFENTFDHPYQTPTFNAQQWETHGSQHFPGAFDSPASHRMPYFQQQTQQPYMMQSPSYMDMPVQMQDNFFNMQGAPQSSYGQNFPDMHGLHMHASMSHPMHHVHYEQQQHAPQTQHAMQQHPDNSHVDPNLLMHSDLQAYGQNQSHRNDGHDFLGNPMEHNEFDFDMKHWMPEERF